MEHFRFQSAAPFEATGEAVLAEVERLLVELAKHRGDKVFLRTPPIINKEVCFETGKTLASVFCRWTVIEKAVANCHQMKSLDLETPYDHAK